MSKSCKFYHFSNQTINFMSLGRQTIVCQYYRMKRRYYKKREIVVQLLSSEPEKKTTMKYKKEDRRVFVLCQYDEITIKNIKEACKLFFREHHCCDALASKMGPCCTYQNRANSTFQNTVYLIYFKIPADDLSSISSRYVSKYSQCDYNPGPSKVPEYSYTHSVSYSAVSHKRMGA